MPISARSRARRAPAGLCPLCGAAARPAFVVRDLNRLVSTQSFRYERCEMCRSYFLDSPPEDITRYYPSGYFNLPSAQTLDALAVGELPTVRMLLERVAPGRLVEIGPGEGVFARAARNAGFAVTGIEMDADACRHLRTVAGVETVNSDAPEEALAALPASDAIVMRHVLEHLPRPWAVIDAAAANLRAGGILLIATPNPRSLQFALLRSRWAHVDAPRHMFLIPVDALTRHCGALGMRLLDSTTSDPAGRHWDRFGWDYAFRRAPRSTPGSRPRTALARILARALGPLERRGHRGCAYTCVFVKGGDGGG
jgi:2-polyprenyl-3-methyl-5-hydroxy-6-metoxy-1,4-benzoquinol methylase